MKTCTLLTIMVFLLSVTAIGQQQPFNYGVRWGLMILKKDNPVGYPGREVHGTVMYKDSKGDVLYSEEHTGVLDDVSFLRFTIGQGSNPDPAEVDRDLFMDVRSFCWDMQVMTDEGPVTFQGEETITSSLSAILSDFSYTSGGLGNSRFNEAPMELDEFVNVPVEKEYGVTTWNRDINLNDITEMRPLVTSNFIRQESSVSVINGNALTPVRFGKGTGWPFVFGNSTPAELENLYTVCVPSLNNFRHGLGVKVAEFTGSVVHNTAAIYADNTLSPMSAGVLANAQTWGMYGTGQNGLVGVTTGLGNGTAVTAFVATAPQTGGFKYASYANSNDLADTWAGAFFGDVFHTGDLTMLSDARLKTEVRSTTSALERILQLRPAQYTYRQDTPWNFPEGLHHGFIAQEVEAIFPELVTDITMPLDTDPQKMYLSETESYKGINYVEMVALLTSAIHEMRQEYTVALEAQAKEIEELRKAIEDLK